MILYLLGAIIWRLCVFCPTFALAKVTCFVNLELSTTMKFFKLLTALLCLCLSNAPCYGLILGDPRQVIIDKKDGNTSGDHNDGSIPLDQPDVYFNSSTMAITIVDYAGCDYDVNVYDSSDNLIDGILLSGSGTFYISVPLTSGTYTIEIDTSLGNTYVGQLNI